MGFPADSPKTDDNRQYHLHTRPGDIAPLCLLVGDPDRATLIAERFFENPTFFAEHRGLRSYTGTYQGIPISVVTTGMGSPSLCIVVPEAYESGARCFIRVGTCGALIERAELGDVIIVNGALRLEGTSSNFAPHDFPARPDDRILRALETSAEEISPEHYFVGVEATTDDFREGQGRPNTEGIITERAREIHEYVMEQKAACYSMEAAALFVWCSTHYGGVPAGVINAVIANRITGSWQVRGEELAAKIALEAMVKVNREISGVK